MPAIVTPEWVTCGLFLILASTIMLAMIEPMIERQDWLGEHLAISFAVFGGGSGGLGIGIVGMNLFFALVAAWWRVA